LDFGLLSSVVNGCQRSEGFAGEDWGHKVERLRRQKAGKAERQKGRKARKHRVTENTERGSRKPGKWKA
jgi:hypothetical protein